MQVASKIWLTRYDGVKTKVNMDQVLMVQPHPRGSQLFLAGVNSLLREILVQETPERIEELELAFYKDLWEKINEPKSLQKVSNINDGSKERTGAKTAKA